MALKNTLFFSISPAVLALDQLTKYFVRKNLELNESAPVLENILHLTHAKNYGVAFGLLNYLQLRWLFIIISVAVIAVIIFYYRKIPDKRLAIVAFALLLAGTLGNLIDRLLFGAVTDFIDFRIWPAFNIADSAITVSIAMLFIFFWKGDKK